VRLAASARGRPRPPVRVCACVYRPWCEVCEAAPVPAAARVNYTL
jgi:hypothetical protein